MTPVHNSTLMPVGSLWIGETLSWLEIASIRSFLDLGHDYTLYSYAPVTNLPLGARACDAREVWDTPGIVLHGKSGSPALHSDIFRVMMARQTGKVWADTDIIAVRPFVRDLGWYIGHERTDKLELGAAILGMPQGAQTLELLYDFLTGPAPVPPWLNPRARARLEALTAAGTPQQMGDMPWGSFGPRALTHFADVTGEIGHAQKQTVFFPVTFQDRKALTDPARSDELTALMAQDQSLCVHLYSRWMRKACARTPHGFAPRDSWLGRWSAASGIVDYDTLPAERAKKSRPRKPAASGRADPGATGPDLPVQSLSGPAPPPAVMAETAQPPAVAAASPGAAPQHAEDTPQQAGGKPAKSRSRALEKAAVKAEKAARDTTSADQAEAFMADLAARRAKVPGGARVSDHGRVTIVTMAKDEGPYLLEWVAWHHLTGFTDILVYTNDCTDGTDELLDALAAHGLVTRLDNRPWKDKPPQSRALHWAEHNPLVQASDWLMVMDFDEFVVIRTPEGTVDSLISEIGARGATGICFTWRFFGSNGLTGFDPAPVTQRMTRAAPDHYAKGYGIKTLYKNNALLNMAIHRPYLRPRFARSPEGEAWPLDWLNGSGEALDGRHMRWRLTSQEVGYDLVQLNHYGVKSREEYMLRGLRGDVLDNHSKYGPEYFGLFDRNDVMDDSALAGAGAREAYMTLLRGFDDIAAACALVEQRRQEKLARLRASDGYSDRISQLQPYDLGDAIRLRRTA